MGCPERRSTDRDARAGLRRGLLALLLIAFAVAPAAVPATAAASPFAWRGIVEASYGRVWSHDDRTRMIDWMASRGLNAYVHAPKDDAYQRANWREPYPRAQQDEFDAEVRYAAARGVQWIPSISPGSSLYSTATNGTPRDAPVCFSCASDLEVVMAKFRPFIADGARSFMVSFDDDKERFSRPEDARAYGTGGAPEGSPAYEAAYGRATGDFLSRLLVRLRRSVPDATLLTVLTDYAGTGDTPYLSGVRATLDPAVGVLWTGPAVQHTNFSPQDAQAYGARIGRSPIIWDNWSNTDGCCTLPASQDHTTALLGPYRRRADIVGSVGGVFLQPTNEADLNKLPLATAADWLADPGGYNPEASWRAELARLTGGNPAAGELLRAWAETFYFTKSDLYTSAIGADRAAGQAPSFRALSGAFLAAYPGAGWAGASASLSQELDKAARARTALAGAADGGFLGQASPFLQGSHMAARAGHLGTALLGAQRPVATVRTDGGLSVTPQPADVAAAGAIEGLYGGAAATQRALIPCSYGFHAARSADGRFACGPGARWYFDAITPNNVLDGYLDEVDRLSAAWRSAAASTNPSQAPLTLSVAGVGDYTVAPGATRALPAAACGRTLTIRDAAGGANSFTLPPCGGDPRTPTTVLDGGPSGSENSRGAVFSFHASVPGSRFTCQLDGAVSACRSPAVYTDLPEGDHSFRVTATDPAGRVASASETRFWRVDTTPPDTAFTRGPSGPTRSETATFRFLSNEAGGFRCSLDGRPFGSCSSPLVLAWVRQGAHTLAVAAVDEAGNVDPTPAVRAWTVDTRPPNTFITRGPKGVVLSARASFLLRASERAKRYSCSLNRKKWKRCTAKPQYAKLRDGRQQVAVAAVDLAGNVDPTPAKRRWDVDAAHPRTTFTRAPGRASRSRKATFAWRSKPRSTFACALDGARLRRCSTWKTFASLKPGWHTLRVRATDRIRRVERRPAAYRWVIDLTRPSLAVGVPSQSPADAAQSGLRLALRCSEACRATVSARALPRDQARLGFPPSAAPILTERAVELRGRRRSVVRLPITAATLRPVARARRLELVVRVTARDRAGNRRVVTRPLTLER